MPDLLQDPPTQTAAIALFTITGLGAVLFAFTKFMKGEKTEAKDEVLAPALLRLTQAETRIGRLESIISEGHPLALEALESCPDVDVARTTKTKLVSLVKLLGGAR